MIKFFALLGLVTFFGMTANFAHAYTTTDCAETVHQADGSVLTRFSQILYDMATQNSDPDALMTAMVPVYRYNSLQCIEIRAVDQTFGEHEAAMEVLNEESI
jgi:hypothetical protein